MTKTKPTTIADAVIQAIELAGINRNQLATALEVGASTVYSIVHGINPSIGSARIERIAEATGCEIGYRPGVGWVAERPE